MTKLRKLMVASLCVALTSSGCASALKPSPSLAETKSPTQLLRNNAASYFSDISDAGPVVVDHSDACLSSNDDPDGLVRRWVSSVDLTLVATVTESLDELPNRVLDPYLANDWIVAYEAAREIGLTNQKFESMLKITPSGGVDGTGAGSHIVIIALGPCVDTGGAESDEVKQLESFATG